MKNRSGLSLVAVGMCAMLTIVASAPANAVVAAGKVGPTARATLAEVSLVPSGDAQNPSPNPDSPSAGTFEAEFVGPAAQEPGNRRMTRGAKICTFIQRVDYVHISTTSNRKAAQSHGNWDNVDCKYTLADVTTQIDRRNPVLMYQAVGTQGRGRLGPNPKGLTSGGAGRVTAHYDCSGNAKADFRSWTSVDIVGYADMPNKVHSPANALSCG